MLRPGLTYDTGVKEIGEIKAKDNWSFDSNSPLVRHLESCRTSLRFLINAGSVGKTNDKIVEHDDLHPDVMRVYKKARIGFLESLGEENGLLYDSSEDPLLVDRCFTYDILDLDTIVTEAITNAIEHGTDYCRNGKLQVQRSIGRDGVIYGIEQKPPFRNFEELLAQADTDEPNSFLKKTRLGKGVWQRGCGLYNFVSRSTPWIWVHQKDASSETVILGLLKS